MSKRDRDSGESTLRDIVAEFTSALLTRLDAIERQLGRIADAFAASERPAPRGAATVVTPPAPPPAPAPSRTSRRPRTATRRGGGKWTFHGKVKMNSADGEAIRRDAATMPRVDLYAKWAQPKGKYTRAQVASAIAWLSGPLPARRRKPGTPEKRRSS